MQRLVICSAFAIATSGCAWAWPQTDIVGVNTSDVGDYYVAAEAPNQNALTATVCVDQPGHDVSIASRIVHELYGKGYRSMRFEMVPAGAHGSAEVTHIAWSDDRGLQVAGRDRVSTANCRVPDPPSRVGVAR